MKTTLCEFCQGSGQLASFLGVSRFLLTWDDCPQCGGTGRIPLDTPGAAADITCNRSPAGGEPAAADNTRETRMEQGKPNPERVALLRSLPLEIKEQITGEEAHAFMFDEPLPESLLEKLKDYLVDDAS